MLTREQVEFHVGQIKYGHAEDVADQADVLSANDAEQRAALDAKDRLIAELESGHAGCRSEIETLVSVVNALEAELARLKTQLTPRVYERPQFVIDPEESS